MRGRTLAGRYTLAERLASGSMGTVWTGWDSVLERQVAVKLLRSPVEDDATFAERFRSEATAMAKLNHPGIVSVYDYGHEPPDAGGTGEPTAFLVMELVTGESLDALLRREGALPPERALDLAVQVLEALRAAHGAGIVHRDVKPSNLLLRDDRILVADFGIALPDFSPRLTASGTRLGTAPYQAPEQAARGRVTPAADLYSVGVVLHEMLAGRVPFDGATAFEITLKHLTEPPPELPDDIPVPVREVVRRALSKAPEERWESAAAMAAELAAVRDAVAVFSSYGSSAAVPAAKPSSATESSTTESSTAGTVTSPVMGGARWRVLVWALVAAGIAASTTAVAVPLALRDGGERRARATAEDAGSVRPGVSPAAPRALAAPGAPGASASPAASASPSASSGHPSGSPTPSGGTPSASGGATPDMTRPSSPGVGYTVPTPAPPAQPHGKGTGDGTGGDSRPDAGRPAPDPSKDPAPAKDKDPAKPDPSKPDPAKPDPPKPPALPAKVQWRNGFTALDNDNSRKTDGNRVGTWDINASHAQQWRPTKYGDGSYTFTNLAAEGKVLDMNRENRMAQIWGTPQGPAANQRWRVVPEGAGYRLINVENQECLTANGLHVLTTISPCNGGAGQLWTAVDADSYVTEDSPPAAG
ncbi:serine/threonine protein kinase [Streptomyces luteoverticillatus]|uniref:non-specific serine/threonine protein kinase n=1 Tax=Streptomyces luteoverticillatus TaxID=66425 RepID=A0A3S9PJ70_STRLT|nr:protein kinase [Streptomyces luteoverticillatus]AZQ72418.1 serine/threonine protein kinase [Streptomyces luteoverticillatus]